MSDPLHITLTPALLARLEQAGLVPGAGNIAVWLTERAETLAALLAPVEGVNVEEVLRLDRAATPGPWRVEGASIRVNLLGGIEYQWASAAYPRDNNLIAHYRTATPVLARALVRERAEAERLRALGRRETALLIAAEQERDEARAEEVRLRAAMVEGEPHSNPAKVFAMVNAERIRRGLSWRDLASHIGVAPSTLSRWAHGKMLSLPAHLRVCQWLKKAVRDTVTSNSEQDEGVVS